MEVIQRKICLLGDFAVGKTSLVRRYVYSKFEANYLATIGVHVSRKEVTLTETGKRVVLVLWDLAGGETFSQMEASYYRGGAGALLVADVLRPDTFSILNTYATTFTQANRSANLVFACNKIDLAPDVAPFERRMQELSARWQAPYFLTSALNGAQVEAAFQALAQSVAGNQT